MPIALWALTVSAFAVGTTEFVIVGLLPIVAADLGVSLPSAGFLVSLYALGVTIGAPVLTAAAGRMQRKRLLLSLMALFIAGNAVASVSPSYEVLVLARFLTGLAHGVFFAIASTIATDLVPENKQSSAIAVVFLGLTVALVTGVPLGTWVGQAFGWQSTFLGVVALGLIGFIASAALVPSDLRQVEPPTFRQQLQVLTDPRLLLIYAMTAVGYGGTFVAFTYLTPILTSITGFEDSSVSLVLLVYGASVAVGNILGGRVADRVGPVRALLWIFGGLAAVLTLFGLTAPSPVLAVATIAIWGAFAFANVPPLQVYVVQLAKERTPSAVDVASGLNIGAFNLGISLGAIVGGAVVEDSGLLSTTWVGAVIVASSLLLTLWSAALDRRKSALA
jgi:predicted MFS family arabinose efflux permease